jgi:putative transposase
VSASYYYAPGPVSDETLTLMKSIDQLHLERPYMGSRQMRNRLSDQGFKVNRKRVQRLMRLMGIIAIYPKPKTSLGNKAHSVYPYLLKGICIERPNQVWVTDITYIQMSRGFCYLIAIMDLFSRKILSWRISNRLDTRFCIEALNEALATYTKPEIFNTDQGSQFTSTEFTSILKQHHIQISMDSKGRWIDNVFIERFWRSLKYEEVYLRAYQSIPEAKHFIGSYIYDYNHHRRHSSLDHQIPDSVYNQSMESFIPTIISHNSHDFIPGPCS